MTKLSQKKFNGWIFASAMLASTGPYGDELDWKGTNENEELALLNLLDEQTEIATKTRMNADFVPGMVTILLARDMANRGIKTVWQALGTVSGMEISLDKIGNQIVKVRQVGGSFGSGNLKIMLNGIAMNSGLTGMAQPIMDMPIEQIDRIEIIRGPGSAIHGEYAFAGVVNIIPIKTAKSFYLGGGKYDSGLIGGTYSWAAPEHFFTSNINLAFSDTDGADMHHESDFLHSNGTMQGLSQASISNAPGASSEDRRYQSIIVDMSYKDFDVNAQWLNNRHGQHYGTFHVLPSADERDYTENEYKTFQVGKSLSVFDNLSSHIQVGWLESSTINDLYALPPGYGIWHYPTFPTTLENGYQSAAYYKEEKYYLGADLFWTLNSTHKLLFSFDYSTTRVKDAWWKNNIHTNGTLTQADDYPISVAQKFTADDAINWPGAGVSRKLKSYTFQDELSLTESFFVTAGVRYDEYSDIGSNVSPRLAVVYHWDEKNIFKTQYAQAFRPPTFFENSWAPNLKPQTIDTLDFSYLHKRSDAEFRLSLFHSKLKNLITGTSPLGFVNGSGATVFGAELEGELQISEDLKMRGNLSYSKSKVDSSNESIPRVANWLSNIFINYEYNYQTNLSLHYQYVGKRGREENDPRDELKAYGAVDLTGRFSHIFDERVFIEFGIDNVFKADIRYPAAMTTDLLGSTFPPYADDYPRPGRVWWMRLKYQLE